MKTTHTPRRCPVCGEWFQAWRLHRRPTCSYQCRAALYTEPELLRKMKEKAKQKTAPR